MTWSPLPTEICLAIPDAIQTTSWQQGQSLTMPGSQRHVYLNRVCLDTVLPWLQAEYVPSAAPWQPVATMAAMWSMVDGVAIALGDKRLVLLPNQTLDTSELRIPQEWVDLPGWAADYFLAVQVQPDQAELRLWGYTTHAQVKQWGRYDADDRTYSIDADDLITDVSLLWVTQARYPNAVTQGTITPLAPVPETQAENLLQRLANSDIVMPRAEIPFALWGALLAQPQWRQRLCELRSQPDRSANVVNLSQWWQSIFDPAWQAIESLVNVDPQLALNLRQAPAVGDRLVRRAQPIQVVTPTVDRAVMLVLALEAEPDERIGIQVQVYGIGGDLPANLELTLRSRANTIIQTVQTRAQDDRIQLRRFKCSTGTQFAIQIGLDDFFFRATFVC